MHLILKEGFGIENRNSDHTESSIQPAHEHLHGLRRNRNSTRVQSAFPHLPGMSGHRKNYRGSPVGNGQSNQDRRDGDELFQFSARPSWLIAAQLRGAFCLLRRTKKVAVATTTSRGTAVNSSRAIADQSVYTAEKGREVAPSSQQAEVLLRDCTTRHSRWSLPAAGRCCRCPANQPAGGTEWCSSLLAEGRSACLRANARPG